MKILVVDDEEHILELIRYNLDAAGYDVIEASDGDDAVKNAINEVPDLILQCILHKNYQNNPTHTLKHRSSER